MTINASAENYKFTEIAELLVGFTNAPQMPSPDAQNLCRHKVIFRAQACNITSCTFIARSTAG